MCARNLVEHVQTVVPRGAVDGHGGVQQPAQRLLLQRGQQRAVLAARVLAVRRRRRRHQAAHAEQVRDRLERALADLQPTNVIILYTILLSNENIMEFHGDCF